MERKDICDWIEMNQLNKDTLLEEQFDDAIVGHDCDKIIYDVDKMEEILVNKGITEEEALDYMEKNCFSKCAEKVTFMFPYNKNSVDAYLFIKKFLYKK